MSFHWTASPPAAADPGSAGLEQRFPTRVDAEAWLTSSYEDLADAGFTEVTLWEDDHAVYGPMSLLP